MFDKIDVFSDIYAQQENVITGIEARTKIVFTVIALVINLVSQTVYPSLSIALFCIVVLLSIGIPPRLLALRLVIPLIMAAIVLVTQIFFYGNTVLFIIPVVGISLTGYEEGLFNGILIMCRVIGGVSLILFLSLSTPAHKLLLAAIWFKVPKIVIELSLLIYRYIFVLLEEMLNIRDAQRVRLGYHNWSQSMKSFSTLGGSLIFRAYDRAERIFEAMTARGYTGAMSLSYAERFDRKDIITAVCLFALLAAFYFTGQLSI
jgi:cobalt/nickel transport system permease protein